MDYRLKSVYEQILRGTAVPTFHKTLTDVYDNILTEKFLVWADLGSAARKYYRLSVVDNKIKNGEPFSLENGTFQKLTYSKEEYGDLFANQKVEELRNLGGRNINKFPFFKTEDGTQISIDGLSKTREFGGLGDKSNTSERQEHGLINQINSIEGPKTIITGNGIEIKGVIKAEKVERIPKRPEPYSDIKLHMEDGSVLLVSAKGDSAPSMGGGGLIGISTLTANGDNPDILDFVVSFYKKAWDFYAKLIETNNLNGINLYKNKLIPDVSIKVPPHMLHAILEGTELMGGPISYYYIGNMDVKIDPIVGNVIKITNGNFIPLDQFIKQYANKLYAHIRKRDGDIFFTNNTFNFNGKDMPMIFIKKNAEGRGIQSRFGIADRVRGVELH